MKKLLKRIRRRMSLLIKSFLYSTLTKENIEKIIKRKEQELEDIDIILEKETKKIYRDLHDELREYYSESEIDEIYKNLIGEDL